MPLLAKRTMKLSILPVIAAVLGVTLDEAIAKASDNNHLPFFSVEPQSNWERGGGVADCGQGKCNLDQGKGARAFVALDFERTGLEGRFPAGHEPTAEDYAMYLAKHAGKDAYAGINVRFQEGKMALLSEFLVEWPATAGKLVITVDSWDLAIFAKHVPREDELFQQDFASVTHILVLFTVDPRVSSKFDEAAERERLAHLNRKFRGRLTWVVSREGLADSVSTLVSGPVYVQQERPIAGTRFSTDVAICK